MYFFAAEDKMRAILTVKENKWGDVRHVLTIGNQKTYCIHSLSECPEDAIIGRDLIDAHQKHSPINLVLNK